MVRGVGRVGTAVRGAADWRPVGVAAATGVGVARTVAVGDGLAGGVGGIALGGMIEIGLPELMAFTAAAALTRPAPIPVPPTWSAVDFRTESISATDRSGLIDSMRATTPETCGAAMEVPLMDR